MTIRLRPVIGALALLLCLSASSASAQFVHTRGKEIVDASGKPLHLHGTNLGNWMVREGYMWKMQNGAPESGREIDQFLRELIGPARTDAFWKQWVDTYITRDDIKQIKAAGFDSIRIPFHWKYFDGDGAEGFRLVDHVVQWSREEGLYVILDMHAAPAGQTGTNIDDSDGWPWLFEDAAAQQKTIDIWRRIAQHYRNNPTVLGYDLLNEPIPNYPEMMHLNPKLEPLYKRISAAIRDEDKNHILILGGAQWDGNLSVFTRPFDKNIVYEVHTYKSQPDQTTADRFTKQRDRLGAPVWLGESGENTDEWIATFARVLKKNDIGWCFWPYKKMDATTSPVTFNQPEHWAEIVAYSKLDREVAHTKQRVKSRPPQEDIDRAIATLLENIRFDHERRNMGYIRALIPDTKLH
ncbi:MAG: glycoside hydrolase family 5 protein [Acidobacteria bacterium]|nr:glycoside hydrolase family 5 protein [Acidobacteriota bacterium]